MLLQIFPTIIVAAIFSWLVRIIARAVIGDDKMMNIWHLAKAQMGHERAFVERTSVLGYAVVFTVVAFSTATSIWLATGGNIPAILLAVVGGVAMIAQLLAAVPVLVLALSAVVRVLWRLRASD